MTTTAQAHQLPKTPAQQAWAKHWPFTRAAPELVRQVQREHLASQRQGPSGMGAAPF